MNILQYDSEVYDFDYITEVVDYLNEHGFATLAIPKNIDLLLDCDSYTLHYFKEKIEDAIRQKEIINGD